MTVPAQAQDVSFEASVNTSKIILGSSVQLSLTLYGKQLSDPIELPPIDAVEARKTFSGPSAE